MLGPEEVRTIIASGECLHVEFKRGLSGKREREICKEIAAFATSKGGTLIIGVDDGGSICGVQDAELVRSRIENWINDCIDPSPCVDVYQVRLPEGMIVVVEVEDGAEPPYMYDGRYYQRLGSSSCQMTAEQVENARSVHEKRLSALEAEMSALRATRHGSQVRAPLRWRPAAPGMRARMYISISPATVEPVLSAVRSVGGVTSASVDRIEFGRCVIVVDLPASAGMVQRSIADRALGVARHADPTVEISQV